ncbi:hypothetical protein DYE49_10485 [Treponema rectale]|uniref:Lipoprotein n=1 Tax=Treponema rectale TaxID=744512 RepID=A0A840S997_9SPIR|nr:hypothetical protein [Treponema rectale]MBB5219259.1 hypothetical protein [Treponema rectale]QOS40856.1 hypothetical protein DYE49_10485 [Treponema rectale]
MVKKCLLIFVFSILFVSCDDFKSGVYFHDYEEFEYNKNAWVEPASSMIEYNFSSGNVGVFQGFKTIRSGIVSEFTVPDELKEEYSKEDFLDFCSYGNIVFYSVTDLYSYIENRYEYIKEYCDSDERYDIYVEYGTVRGIKYIKEFTIEYEIKENLVGDGTYGVEVVSYSESE